MAHRRRIPDLGGDRLPRPPGLPLPDGAAREPAARFLRFVAGSPIRIRGAFPPGTDLRRGDPVFVTDDQAFLVRCGTVVAVREEPDGLHADIAIYPERSSLLREDVRLEAFTVSKTAAWIAGTLLPPERIAEIRAMISRFLAREGDSLGDLLWPHVKQGLLDTVRLYGEELPKAISGESERWNDALSRLEEGAIREALVPALEKVTLVIAKEKFSPLLEQVGKELWEALPVWGLGWRAVWEKVPFTRSGQVRKKFEDYLEDDAEPILESHSGEAAGLAGEVFRESLKDPRVKGALGAVFAEFLSDPKVGALLEDLATDLVIENERFHEIWRRRWSGGLEAAVLEAADRLEPLVERIADSILLDSGRSAVNPRLTHVLRTRVLRKDCRWVLLTSGDGEAPP